MDNITHSLLGFAIGEAALQLRARRLPARPNQKFTRAALWIVSAIASNFPDLDMFYTPITEAKFGTVLHHRGHTHTLVMAPLQSALVVGLFWLWLKLARRKESPPWAWLWLVSLLGPLLHIAMDYLNSYGVHPFWPFDNHWFYGDCIFIIEPLFWISLLPLLIFTSSGLFRKLFSGLFALAFGLLFFTGYVPWQLAMLSSLAGAWLLGLMFKVGPPARVVSSLGALVMIIAVFSSASTYARAKIEKLIHADFPTTVIRDLILSPMPANPVCWMLFSVETQDSNYMVRRGLFSLAPHFMGAAQCPNFFWDPITTQLKPVKAPLRPELIWSGQFEAPLTELAQLKREYCGVSALLKFLRAPVWTRVSDGGTVLGDLRYDRTERLDMAEVYFSTANAANCPKRIPPWEYPRVDILSGL